MKFDTHTHRSVAPANNESEVVTINPKDVLDLIKRGDATVKIIGEPWGEQEYSIIKQLKNLNTRPPSISDNGTDGIRYHPRTKQFYQKKKKDKQKIIYTHTKKTCTSLLPPNGRMTLFGTQTEAGVGLLWDINECALKEEKYLFIEEAMMFSEWHKGKKHDRRRNILISNTLEEYKQEIKTRSEQAYPNPIPYTDTSVGINIAGLRAIIIQPPTCTHKVLLRHDFYEMYLEAMKKRAYMQQHFSVDLPIVILNAYSDPIEYTLEEQANDIEQASDLFSNRTLLTYLKGKNPLTLEKALEILKQAGQNPSEEKLEKSGYKRQDVFEAIEIVHIARGENNLSVSEDEYASLIFYTKNILEYHVKIVDINLELNRVAFFNGIKNFSQYKNEYYLVENDYRTIVNLYNEIAHYNPNFSTKIELQSEINFNEESKKFEIKTDGNHNLSTKNKILEVGKHFKLENKERQSYNQYSQLCEVFLQKIDDCAKRLYESSSIWTIGKKKKSEEIRKINAYLRDNKYAILNAYAKHITADTTITDFFNYLMKYHVRMHGKETCLEETLLCKRYSFFNNRKKESNTYKHYKQETVEGYNGTLQTHYNPQELEFFRPSIINKSQPKDTTRHYNPQELELFQPEDLGDDSVPRAGLK